MKKVIILYGLSLAALVAWLKVIEYRFLVHDFSLEFYVGTIAVLFTVFGIWVGLRLTRKKTLPVNTHFEFNESEFKRLGLSKRELEVLELIVRGYSNQEIADQLFVSLNTVKTHSSSIFNKMEVRRRTQAVQKARELQLVR